MRRRAFLATAGTVALAGCTASEENDESEPSADDYEVRGLEDSSIYLDYEIAPASIIIQLFGGGFELGLAFDADADYDPLEHEVLLVDGHDRIAEGYETGAFDDDEPRIGFGLSPDELDDGGPYRLVSKDPVGVVEEVALEIVRTDGEDQEASTSD